MPSLTVLTGKNGSGKSHLLSAIEGGQISCSSDGQPIQAGQGTIRSYSWSTLVPQETSAYSSEQAKTERQNIWNQIQANSINLIRQNLRMFASQRGLGSVSDQELLQASFDQFPLEQQTPQLRDLLLHRDNFLTQQLHQYQHQAGFSDLVAIANRKNKTALSLTQDEIQSASLTNYGSTSLFQQSFSRLFGAYRDLRLENYVQEL